MLRDRPDSVVERRIAQVQVAILDDEAGRAGAADGAALLARLAAAHHRVTGDDRELVRSFLRTDAGRETATGVARSATRLLTHGCFEAVNPAARATPAASRLAAHRGGGGGRRPAEPACPSATGSREGSPARSRSGLWSALRDDPARVGTRLRNRLILLLLGTAGVVFALGGLVGAAAALYHSGDQVFRWTAFGLVLAVLAGFLTAAWRTLAAADPVPGTVLVPSRNPEQPAPTAAAP